MLPLRGGTTIHISVGKSTFTLFHISFTLKESLIIQKITGALRFWFHRLHWYE